MEASGWIVSSAAADAGKTRKRMCRVLPPGREELLRWALEPSEPMDLRDALMVRLRADAAIGPLGLQTELERQIALHQNKLQRYREIERHDFPSGHPTSRDARIHRMILQKGILYEEASIQWTQQMLAVLRDPAV